MDQKIRIEDLARAYKCSFAEDGRTVGVVVGSQWLSPAKLDFGEGAPGGAVGNTPEQFHVTLEAPIQDGAVMMAMSRVEIYSHTRAQHARFSRSLDNEEFLTKLANQISKLVRIKRETSDATSRPMTRKPLEKLIDEINKSPIEGDVGLKGIRFVDAWLDKNALASGDSGEELFLVNALTIYKKQYAKRKQQ